MHNLAIKAAQSGLDRAGDRAISDQADPRPGQIAPALVKIGFGPEPAPDPVIADANPAQAGQHQADGQIGDRRRVDPRTTCHQHTTCLRRDQRDPIYACAPLVDQPQPGGFGQQLRWQFDSAHHRVIGIAQHRRAILQTV